MAEYQAVKEHLGASPGVLGSLCATCTGTAPRLTRRLSKLEQQQFQASLYSEMEEEIAELRRLLAESQERTANEQRRSAQAEARAAEEQRRREEEQRRREAAEADAEQSQPKNLVDFLKSCHSFSLALQAVTDETLTTQGDTTKPAGRLFPRRIVPWNDFPVQQRWN